MIGRLIDGRYQVRSRIARGGMATVYLATDLRLERRVAIKVMHGHLADDSKFKQRFIQEARSAARLAHPNVVNVFDQGQDSDMAYLVMEYLSGITLRDLLHDHGRLTAAQTLDVLESVLSGLAAAHKAGIVHRDLKPENVLLADDGRIKIGDFGLARAASANTATGAALLGTIAYLSPELVTRGVADTRSDIYAVGIMMYEMLTGDQPFKGEQPMQIAYQHANGSVPTPSTRNPKVPAELDELVLWATAREPDERPRDARMMLDQLLATKSLLQTALPTGATAVQRTAVQRTAVLDATAATAVIGSDSETQVLRGSRRAAEPERADSTTTLRIRSQKRHARGWWLFSLVILLAALAGGTGVYFGSGPGSQLAVPGVEGMTEDAARQALGDAGFTVAEETGTAFHPTIAEGLVVATTPEAGAVVVKGTTPIILLLSTGPEQLSIPVLEGLSEEAALLEIERARFTAAESHIRQFDAGIARGTVLAALDDEGESLAGRETYGEQKTITLVVSHGPVPEVQNLKFDDAVSALRDVELTAVLGSETYHDSIEAGRVIAIATAGPFRVGGEVALTVSRGPEMILIPDVIGWKWDDAKAELERLEFDLQYSPIADFAPGSFTVASLDPEVGKSLPKGSRLKVKFDGF